MHLHIRKQAQQRNHNFDTNEYLAENVWNRKTNLAPRLGSETLSNKKDVMVFELVDCQCVEMYTHVFLFRQRAGLRGSQTETIKK